MTTTRWRKILKISQAHIAAGMSLTKWQAILSSHGIPLEMSKDAPEWADVSDEAIDGTFGEIWRVVEAAKRRPLRGLRNADD